MAMSMISFGSLFAVCIVSAGCAPPRQACTPDVATAVTKPESSGLAPRPEPERHVYRFDFALATGEPNGPSSANGANGTTGNIAFSLELEEFQKGEVIVGKNVPLSAPIVVGASGAVSSPMTAGARQDVGTKITAMFRSKGDDVILDVNIELSVFDPPSTIRKVVAKGNAFATTGKPSTVMTLDDDPKHYRLTVTPTKLR